MKKYISKLNILVLVLIITFFSSCSESFFDINEDPNNPTTASLNLLLTNSQVAIAEVTGLSTTGLSSHYSVFMHQTVRRGDPDRYGTLGNSFMINSAWTQLYDIALQDLEIIINQTAEVGSTGVRNLTYSGIAKLLKAYAFSMMVDAWGDVPFLQALNLNENQNPQFDDDAMIYSLLFDLIDEGISELNETSSTEIFIPGSDDLIYGGNPSSWISFGKTLQLKLLNQVRMVSDFPNAASDIQSIIAEDNLINGIGGNFQLLYNSSSSPENRHPAFVLDYTGAGKTYYISPWFWDVMNGKNTNILSGVIDPRVPYYFHKQLTPGEAPQNPAERLDPDGFLTIHFGSNGPFQAGAQGASQTILGIYPIGGYYDDGTGQTAGSTAGTGAVPERMLTYYTRLFIEAELALDGIIDKDDRTILQAAIQASFDNVNTVVSSTGTAQTVPLIDQESIDAYIVAVLAEYDVGDLNRKLEIILTQKWIAGFGNSIDAYNDYRRRGYPVIFDPNTDTGPFAQITSSSNQFLVSLPWRADDLNLNPNAPAQKNPTTDGIFWDPN